MPTYSVSLAKIAGHTIPKLLADVGAFVAKQPHGALGWFDAMHAEAIPKEWSDEHAARLRKAGFAFLQLPDGSLVALLSIGKTTPVVLLGSEGEASTLADSLEAFVIAWAKGETGVSDLDDDEAASGRKALAAFVKKTKIKAPKAAAFDFQAWLDSGDGEAKAPPPAKALESAPSETTKKLGPKLRAVAALVGLRADDPKVVGYVTKELKKKVIATTSDRNDADWVVAPKQGLQLLFGHSVHNEKYPPIAKTAKSFVPYLERVDVDDKIGEEVLGVPWKATTAKEIVAVLGEPHAIRPFLTVDDKPTIPTWTYVVDAARDVTLEIQFRNRLRVSIFLKSAAMLDAHASTSLGVFLGWAAQRDLLDPARSGAHASLLKDVKAKKKKGSELFAVALGRGLWDDHVVDKPGLRIALYRWFHNLKGSWITADLKSVFGKRQGPHGHDEPKLDDDGWDAVDKATTKLDDRFAKWL